MLGFINLNKPVGITSHDCVAAVRRSLKIKRVGHGGTLDPAARGVLPIAIGKATRLLSFLPEDKAYLARIRFGILTTTDDLEGEIIASKAAPHLTLDAIETLLPNFVGDLEQIPPIYSAISQGGKRLYELARKGEQVEVAPRQVKIMGIEIIAWYPGEFPEIELAIACGAGTYIRSIARDLGSALGIGGTLAALTRTSSCGFNLSESVTLEVVKAEGLIPPTQALAHLPLVELSAVDAARWCQGNQISLDSETSTFETRVVRVQQENGFFLGVGKIAPGLLIPKIVAV